MADDKYLNLTGLQYFARKLDSKKANVESPALTGTPTAPTATVGTDTIQIATTAFVNDSIDTFKASIQSTLDKAEAGNSGETIDISTKADIDSPALTGVPTAPTADAGTSTTQLATTEFVMQAIQNAISALTIDAGTSTENIE